VGRDEGLRGETRNGVACT